MRIFLHLLATFDALVDVNDYKLGTIERKFLEPVSLKIDNFSKILLKVAPLESENSEHKKLLGYVSHLKLKNGQLRSSNNLVKITKYPNNHYEVLLLENSLINHIMPEVLAQNSYNMKNSTHVVTVFFDGINQISIEGKEMIFNHKIDYNITGVEVEKLNSKNLVIIKADTKGNDIYTLILGYDNDYRVLFEGLVHKIEVEDKKITLLKKAKDFAKQATVEEYEIENNKIKLSEEYNVYLENQAKIANNRLLIPFAFLQAVKQKNYDLARNYLSAELTEVLKDEHLKAYFGNFQAVKQAIYEQHPSNKIAIIYEDDVNVAKVFEIEFLENKITNITER